MFARGSHVWLASALTPAIITLILSIWLWSIIGLGVATTLFAIAVVLAYFFRDPRRIIGDGIVSPADGRVALIDGEEHRLSVILGLRDVHITRAPVGGRVSGLRRVSGRHRPAYEDVSETNERVEIILASKLGNLRLVLVTGIVARRILPYVRTGDDLSKGDRVGIITFGSRVDLHLPEGCTITAHPGDRVRAGESRVAEAVDDAD
jgi:phosphatidylserine decarboxylase